MEDRTPLKEISRRRMLKRIGAGAAIAWSAPVLTSLRVPAFAQATSGPCSGVPCQGFPECSHDGTDSKTPTCHCHFTAEGDCVCFNNAFCKDMQTCNSSADCANLGPGWRCLDNDNGCHASICSPPCGFVAQSDGIVGADPMIVPPQWGL